MLYICTHMAAVGVKGLTGVLYRFGAEVLDLAAECGCASAMDADIACRCRYETRSHNLLVVVVKVVVVTVVVVVVVVVVRRVSIAFPVTAPVQAFC